MIKRTTSIEESFHKLLTAEAQSAALIIVENYWQNFGSLIKPVVSTLHRRRDAAKNQNYIHGPNFVKFIPVRPEGTLTVFPVEYAEKLMVTADNFQ